MSSDERQLWTWIVVALFVTCVWSLCMASAAIRNDSIMVGIDAFTLIGFDAFYFICIGYHLRGLREKRKVIKNGRV